MGEYGLHVRRWLERLTDFGPPLAIAGLGLAEMAGASFGSAFAGPRPVEALFLLAGSLPLAARRYWPLPVFLCIGVVNGVWIHFFYAGGQPQPPIEAFLAFMLAAYSAGAHTRGRAFWIAVAVLGAGIASDPLTGGNLANDLAAEIFFAAAFAIGVGVRRQRDLSISLREAVARLEVEREERTRLATELERTRIARELHDVVAHAISVMVVQAGAERRTLGPGQEATTEVLRTIERTGREALTETRAILGTLREREGQLALSPQPTLDDLPTLVEKFRAAGLDIDFKTEGRQPGLPGGLQLTVYRTLQEALTNVLKHASGASAKVRLCFERDRVKMEISNDGPTAAVTSSSGHGLIGIRERTEMHHGRFSAGPAEGGGFILQVELPLEVG